MKTRFDTYDLVCSIAELQKLVGMRVNQIYDIDHRTYLIRLQRSEEKKVLLLESGNRIHTTAFEWPKNVAPSGFSMKMRKHLKNKRLESLTQIGCDRMVDLQFGSNQAAYHVILEVYDRGNIVLTDHEYTILNILRPHTEGDKIRLAIREKYPTDRAHLTTMSPPELIHEKLSSGKTGDPLKKILNPLCEFGSALIDHVLLLNGFVPGCKVGKSFFLDKDFDRLMVALNQASNLMEQAKTSPSKGYIVQKKETKAVDSEEFILANIDFHPRLLEQFKEQPFKEFDTFDLAVDEYYSTMEGQKLDLKALAQEREALKKLENVRKDHNQRLAGLEAHQETDKQKAEMIILNQELVDNAILAIQSALANQMPWPDIQVLITEAQVRGDPVALAIKALKLETNHISVYLTNPYDSEDSSNENEGDVERNIKPMLVDIDLAQTAYGNALKYFDQKRSAAKKHQKTIDAQGKALKSAERKTKQTLKEVQAIHSINKVRKVYWFEKFYWFITSENYLVIGGRDMQQNELIVKKYLRAGDVYVHADLTGASSIVVKNPSGNPVPPKSLAEAGTMAVVYSVAWDAKVVAGAWWVHHDQVSKTAPTGEYLTTGSFMIRGKKNYLPPCQLVMGLAFLFRLEDGSIERHKGERKFRGIEDDESVFGDQGDDVEIDIDSGNDSDGNDSEGKEDFDAEGNENDADKEETVEKLPAIEENDSDSDQESLFPDTQIKLDLTGSKVKLLIDNKRPLEPEEEIVYLGDDKPVVVKHSQKSKPKAPETPKEDAKDSAKVEPKDSGKPKRGQKAKLKKIKEKYKDQDEEDRRIIMEMTKPNPAREERRMKKKKNVHLDKNQQKKKGGKPMMVKQAPEGEEDDEEVGPAPELDMLDQFTGKPVDEDELLFAVPVIAPYSTVVNYKYKIKLMPGTGKRGKAAKTAVAMFLKDKAATPREKDLLKAVKDEVVARNIPGKVKISAPQALRGKK
ncbi:GSCOCG00005772001-RA-CDS [Cotesia congregata]|uniref:Similar to Clbn: Nuclear export mediator factor NEMF homolog (Drosophila melanogaster) n=1 Tax=Cotesia congregata TaxID=51543 RepID=A0A8J2H8U4_COTCN|nr:GSCOCG00005772001-RA-CDS [Cotesia congregata]CAG5083767.1 Similar to Clbn: Nuclear export mediator factor NEMF homolog (Drosophila melanogaster) [Cotesia congregata]